MLRIVESMSAGQAKSYFSTADYYSEGQELVGQWRGEGAQRLGLSGEIQTQDWDALCDNLHPQSGDRLTLRTREHRRVGYDFNFHVPKSLSVLYALTQDERLLEAFRDSVRETMGDMEAEMQTRIRKDGRNEDRTTGNMVWGEFVHFTSRPIDGVPDPHLHAHCYVFNTTFDEQEAAWKAGQFGSLKRDAPYFEGKFHVRLGHKLAELGVAVDRKQKFWEVAGISPAIVEKFSRRTQEIEEEAERQGINDPAAKAELGAKTRSRKQKDLPLDVLRDEWRSRLTEGERESLALVADRIGGKAVARDSEVPRSAVALATDHCFERQSVVPERKLLAESLMRAVGQATVRDVEQVYNQEEFIIRDCQGRRMVTTPKVLSEEQQMLDFARKGRGSRRAFASGPHEFTRSWLNDGQRKAVEHVIHSTDRVILIRGAAGTGKTSMMQETAEAIRASGTQVFAFAPSAKASRDVLRSKGFDDAETTARLLVDAELQQRVRGQVIWIDEAGMVGVRTMSLLFELAGKLDARVILSGDRFQHGSVERGAALRLLEQQAGLVPAEIKEILRQKDQYKHAVRDLSEERTTEGFRKLDEMGWVREVSIADRYRVLANDYLDAVAKGESALVVSPTHLEAERITRAIREGLKSNGRMECAERRFATLYNSNLTEGERGDAVNYSAGDVLIFHQNAKGYKRGQRVEIDETPPPVDQAARFQLFHPGFLDVAEGDVLRITQNGKTLDERGRLNNGDLLHVSGFDKAGNILTKEKKTIAKDFGHLSYGYVVTSHGSQGTDVKRVFIGQSADSFAASSREQFYVSVSRGQKQATVYTDNKAELLNAVRKSDERLSATELLSRAMIAERAPGTRDYNPLESARRPAQHERKKEELTHER
ncbi:MAG: relaxase domain-containing protein [Planctomycetes bacterium]|nr:relaxase domain-containing protein [Planctomycetota bacterium]